MLHVPRYYTRPGIYAPSYPKLSPWGKWLFCCCQCKVQYHINLLYFFQTKVEKCPKLPQFMISFITIQNVTTTVIYTEQSKLGTTSRNKKTSTFQNKYQRHTQNTIKMSSILVLMLCIPMHVQISGQLICPKFWTCIHLKIQIYKYNELLLLFKKYVELYFLKSIQYFLLFILSIQSLKFLHHNLTCTI